MHLSDREAIDQVLVSSRFRSIERIKKRTGPRPRRSVGRDSQVTERNLIVLLMTPMLVVDTGLGVFNGQYDESSPYHAKPPLSRGANKIRIQEISTPYPQSRLRRDC